MIGNMKNIVDVKVYSKPQDIFKQLLNAEFSLILHSHKNHNRSILMVRTNHYQPFQQVILNHVHTHYKD